MAQHDTAALDSVPRKTLSMRGESLRKPLANDGMRRSIGGAIERALAIAGMTKQRASVEMGYGDNQAPLSRWIAGVETPQFARLFAVDVLRVPLVQALAELAQADGVTVETHITLRRRA